MIYVHAPVLTSTQNLDAQYAQLDAGCERIHCEKITSAPAERPQMPYQRREAAAGEPQRAVARSYNVSQSTIARLPYTEVAHG